MHIQVWADVVCPWCYIGKARLRAALAEHPGGGTVTFRAFQLDPAPVASPGPPVKRAMAEHLGDAARVDEMLGEVTALAAAEGLTIDYDRAIAANTYDAHRLVAWAAGQGRQADMFDALQRAHFTDGVDVGSHRALVGVAASIGLDFAAALAYLESTAGTNSVEVDLAEARELGVTTVPFFLIDRRFAVQGAQDKAVLLDAFAEITRMEAVDADR